MGNEAITVYHGGTECITHPLTGLGRDNLDFGKGFYVTNIKDQALRWGVRTGRLRGKQPVLNVYRFDVGILSAYRYKYFEGYDEGWLDFIVANRLGKNVAASFDVVEGGVANDRVIDSIEAYMSGLMPKDLCLSRLSEHRPNNQICILNQELCDRSLSFVESLMI